MRYNTMIDSKINRESFFEPTESEIEEYIELESLYNKIVSDIDDYYGIPSKPLKCNNKGTEYRNNNSALFIELHDGAFPKLVMAGVSYTKTLILVVVDKNNRLDEEGLGRINTFIKKYIIGPKSENDDV